MEGNVRVKPQQTRLSLEEHRIMTSGFLCLAHCRAGWPTYDCSARTDERRWTHLPAQCIETPITCH